MVATASSFAEAIMAQPGRGEWLGRGGQSALKFERRGTAWLFAAALVNMAAILSFFSALNLGKVVRVEPLVACNPLLTILWSVLCFRRLEQLTARDIVGAVIIIAAFYTAELNVPALMASAGLVLLGVLWGGGFLFVRIAVPAFGPVALVDVRVLIAGVVLLARVAARGELPPFWRRWREYLVLGALNVALPFTLIAWAALTVPASLGSILMATVPLYNEKLEEHYSIERGPFKKALGRRTQVILVQRSPSAWKPCSQTSGHTRDDFSLIVSSVSTLATLVSRLSWPRTSTPPSSTRPSSR